MHRKKAEAESGHNGIWHKPVDAVITIRSLSNDQTPGNRFSRLEPEPADTAFSLASYPADYLYFGGHLKDD